MKFRKTLKSNTTMSIDVETLTELRRRRINISGLVNDFLNTYLGKAEEPNAEEKNELVQEIAIAKNRMLMLEEKKKHIEKEEEEKQKEELKHMRPFVEPS